MPPFQIRLRSPLVETEEIADSSCAVGNVDGLEEDTFHTVQDCCCGVSFRIDIGGKVLTNHLKEVISYRSAAFFTLFFLSLLEV